MSLLKSVTVGILVCLVAVGCTGREEEKTERVATEVQETSISKETGKIVDPATVGTVRGRVLFQGQAPAPRELSVKGNPECAALHPGGVVGSEELLVRNGLLQNVFLYIKEGLEGYTFDPPADPAIIANRGCVYVPHVSGVRVNQPVVLLNEDPTLHNIHSFSKNSPVWNLGLPFQGMKQTKKFSAAEVMVPLKCDVHPWMIGYVGVVGHPYFAVSGADGGFELKDLPPGEVVVEAWHEKLGVQSQTIRIEPRETKEIEFRY